MAKKITPITVTLKQTRAKQPWTFTINDIGPGPLKTVRERYTRKSSAKRGAVRAIGGYVKRQYNHATGRYKVVGYFTQKGAAIVFK